LFYHVLFAIVKSALSTTPLAGYLMTLFRQSLINNLPKYLIFLAVLLLSVLLIWYITRTAPPFVQLVKVARGEVTASVSNTRAGSIKACHRAKLSAPSGGQIISLVVKKGERVRAGQVLLQLWNKDLQEQANLAKAQLATSQNQAVQSCLQADLLDNELTRTRQLYAKGFISREGLDQKITGTKVARSGCHAADNMIKQSKSRIAAAYAALDRMVLRAPFDGIVAEISGEIGEYATPSPPGIPTPPAIDLIDDSCLFVSAPIDEVDAARIKTGQSARITLDAIKGKSFDGIVKRIAPYVLEVEKQARTVEVEVKFTTPPASENLLAGYSADVEIIYARHENVLRIPTQSLMAENHVLLFRSDGVLEDRAVGTGLANWDYTEITSGLNEGDQIVKELDHPGVKAGIKVKNEK
jgi:HlyD family secretion protein